MIPSISGWVFLDNFARILQTPSVIELSQLHLAEIRYLGFPAGSSLTTDLLNRQLTNLHRNLS